MARRRGYTPPHLRPALFPETPDTRPHPFTPKTPTHFPPPCPVSSLTPPLAATPFPRSPQLPLPPPPLPPRCTPTAKYKCGVNGYNCLTPTEKQSQQVIHLSESQRLAIHTKHHTTMYDVKNSPHRVILRRGNEFSVDAVLPAAWATVVGKTEAGWKRLELVLRHPDHAHRYALQPTGAKPKDVSSSDDDDAATTGGGTAAATTVAAVARFAKVAPEVSLLAGWSATGPSGTAAHVAAIESGYNVAAATAASAAADRAISTGNTASAAASAGANAARAATSGYNGIIADAPMNATAGAVAHAMLNHSLAVAAPRFANIQVAPAGAAPRAAAKSQATSSSDGEEITEASLLANPTTAGPSGTAAYAAAIESGFTIAAATAASTAADTAISGGSTASAAASAGANAARAATAGYNGIKAEMAAMATASTRASSSSAAAAATAAATAAKIATATEPEKIDAHSFLETSMAASKKPRYRMPDPALALPMPAHGAKMTLHPTTLKQTGRACKASFTYQGTAHTDCPVYGKGTWCETLDSTSKNYQWGWCSHTDRPEFGDQYSEKSP